MISLYIRVFIKTIPWKFHIFNPKNFRIIHPWSLHYSKKVGYFITCSVVSVCLWTSIAYITGAYISKSKSEKSRPSGAGEEDRGGVIPPSPKFSVYVPLFADEPFKCARSERSNRQQTMYVKINKQNHKQVEQN